jgi:hypothetical protein
MAASFRVGLIAVAALAAVAHASARPECTAGTHTSGGVTYRAFCGPAHATLHDGGKTYSFSGGSCMTSGSTFSINIGTITLPPGKPTSDYFGITVVGAHAGTLTNQAVAWQQPHTNPGSLATARARSAAHRVAGPCGRPWRSHSDTWFDRTRPAPSISRSILVVKPAPVRFAARRPAAPVE